MKYIKKIVSLLLVIVAILSLAACNKKEPSSLIVSLPGGVTDSPIVRANDEEAAARDNEIMTQVLEATRDFYMDSMLFRADRFFFSLSPTTMVYTENFSCYKDSRQDETTIITDGESSWRYDISKLSMANELYLPSGKMQGLTITFFPEKTTNGSKIKIRDARINEMVVGQHNGFMYSDTIYIDDLDGSLCDDLCNKFGEEIVLKSQRYANSSFTIFVNSDIMDVYGCWNGIYVPDGAEYNKEQLKALNSELNNEDINILRDEYSIGELNNAIKYLSADYTVFDELLLLSCENNVSCYLDTPSEQMCSYEKIPLGSNREWEWYTYDVPNTSGMPVCQYVGGNIRGVTLTFTPQEFGIQDVRFVLSKVEINKFLYDDTHFTDDRAAGEIVNRNPKYSNYQYFSEESVLYNKLRELIGDDIKLYSDLGQNSEYTVFIQIRRGEKQDYLHVYGQWANNILS